MSLPTDEENSALLLTSYQTLRQTLLTRLSSSSSSSHIIPPLPPPPSLSQTLTTLPDPTSPTYLHPLGPSATLAHLHTSILPSLSNQSLTPLYLAFVTGGSLPVAEAADNLVSALDNSAQVHLPYHSATGFVEDSALRMLITLLALGEHKNWPARTFTTGATASNILGLACGREFVISHRLPQNDKKTVAEMGLLEACRVAGIKKIQVLTSAGHSSLSKAASIVGLGYSSVKEVRVSEEEPWRLDLDAVERELERGEEDGVASIVVISAGEVNTGRFATGVLDMPKLRSLADRHGAWIHVDGAFGIFARVLPKTDDFLDLHAHVAGLELADSIALDAHKILNVPYDAGVFLSRNAAITTQVCQNPNAAYLTPPSTTTTSSEILPPLNIGLENSRRFRALPVYAVLLSEGLPGISSMVARMVRLARRIASFIRDSPHYTLLPSSSSSSSSDPSALTNTFIIVLFRARNEILNETLVDKINALNKIFISGTVWRDQKAARIAVSNWRCDVDRDFEIVKDVLRDVAESFSSP
ncbi:L-2,4-diaminobutyrate decarboxylase [Echria macrotheca]|uniref:L-2,4-diaminobutyrate decarboxylase n=1 Tax=Echria macrotheca TaxID=438768 RepID=A0AAJ0FB03_9PEZI|nr:L-2,4-diaminobutyrate decarboxylase [Echria macrotheca]